MSVFRVEKNKGYTVMSNHHIYEQPQTQPDLEESVQTVPALAQPTLEKPMLDSPALENPTQ